MITLDTSTIKIMDAPPDLPDPAVIDRLAREKLAQEQEVKPVMSLEEQAELLREAYGLSRSETLGELMRADVEDRYLVCDVLVDQQPMVIAGPSKAMKTTIAAALALSIASGKPFFGIHRFSVTEKRKIHFCSAESGRATTKKMFFALCKLLGTDWEEIESQIVFDWWVPKASNTEMMTYFEFVVRASGAQVSFIDPLYQTLDDQQASVIANGQQLAALAKTILDIGALPIMLDHAKRSSDNVKQYEPLQLEDISGAGKAEFFRQWLLLSRRERFEPSETNDHIHRVWMTLGGSAGHASQWSIDIIENNPSPKERSYTIEVESYSNAKNSKKEQVKKSQQSKDEENERKKAARIESKANTLMGIFETNGLSPLTKTDISGRLRLSKDDTGMVIGHLLNENKIRFVPKSVMKNHRFEDGYQPSSELPLSPVGQVGEVGQM